MSTDQQRYGQHSQTPVSGGQIIVRLPSAEHVFGKVMTSPDHPAGTWAAGTGHVGVGHRPRCRERTGALQVCA